MEYGIRKSIFSLQKNSYVNDNQGSRGFSNFLNCSNGINPFGFSKTVAASLRNIPLEIINSYPEDSLDIKESIVDFWSETGNLTNEQILLGNGSIEIIYKINKLFICENARVLGYSPQFTDYINDVKTYGGKYEYYLMDKDKNFKFNSEDFLARMDGGHRVVYLDNPNNPTGQIIGIDSIEEIVKKAYRLKIPIIIDEAYGDFMDKENSAIGLTNKYDNLFVLRTFSKGFGLAGIRAAYAVTSKYFADLYLKVSNPFEMNGLARYLAIAALKDTSFMEDSIESLKTYKEKFMGSLNKFTVLETSPTLPILTIRAPDTSLNLGEFLLKHKIMAVSGESFIGLGKNFARIRLPKNLNRLIESFREAEKSI